MPRLLTRSAASVRDLANAAISVVHGAFPGSTTFPGVGGGGSTYPGATTFPGSTTDPGGGSFLFPGRGSSLGAAAATARTLTETTA